MAPAILVVAILSIPLGSTTAIVLSAFLDLLGGILMTVQLRKQLPSFSNWAPLGLIMGIAAISGGLLLKSSNQYVLHIILSFMLISCALWIFFKTTKKQLSIFYSIPFFKSVYCKIPVSFLSGFIGGLFGLSGPIIATYLALIYSKIYFRSLLVSVLVFTALTRFGTYVYAGDLSSHLYLLIAISIPALLIGLLLGNKIFNHINETLFLRIISVLIFGCAIFLLYQK